MKTNLILGPPGTGKTETLLNIIEALFEKGIKPWSIAFVAFTRKAATEAKERAMQKFNLKDSELPYFRTLHSMCFKEAGLTMAHAMRRKHWKEVGELTGFRLTGYVDQEGPEDNGDKYLALDGLARTKRVSLEEVWQTEEAADGVDFYTLKYFSDTLARYKSSNGLFDFTDQLEEYLKEGAPLNVTYALIDEAQDLSLLQWLVIKKLFSKCKIIWIAGDDDQAIYKWSGAAVDYFLNIEAERQVLKQSYRIPQSVFNLSKNITDQISKRYPKEFKSREEEGQVDWVAGFEHLKLTAKETWFFLVRNRFFFSPIIEFLEQNGYVYSVNGESSINQGDCQAIYAYTALQKGKEITEKEQAGIFERMKENKINLKKDWHDALDNIPLLKREYYRSALRQGFSLKGQPTIMVDTIHGVKGAEADNVVLRTDLAYKSFLSFNLDPDSEHRVFYTAVTRAKSHLYILAPETPMYYSL